MKQETKIRFEPTDLARLQAVAEATGHSLASIVRYCVEKHLPTLEARFRVAGQPVPDENQYQQPIVSKPEQE